MLSGNPILEINCASAEALDFSLVKGSKPIIFRGLVRNWAVVRASKCSDLQAAEYILQFYQGRTVNAFYSKNLIEGRYFYNSDFSEFNFDRLRTNLSEVLNQILSHADNPARPSWYVGSTTVDLCLPGFRSENDIEIPGYSPLVSIWMGNQSRVACHYDAPDNLACVAVGARRFTLFPPDQIENLYPGPIDFTPAGQAISLVDFSAPDFDKFPRFRKALEQVYIAELNAGDALYLPSMWWHQVEGLSSFNVLVNYWWRQVPNFYAPAIDAIRYAILSTRDLPEAEKKAVKALFDFYVFGDPDIPREHVPLGVQESLGVLDTQTAKRIRAYLLNRLNF